jgi:hypothetical protein
MMLITSRSTPIAPLCFPDKKSERKAFLSDEKIPQLSTTQIQCPVKTEKDQNEAIKKKLPKQAAKPQ